MNALMTALLPEGAERRFIIWSFKQHAWWKPQGRGYTVNTLLAGLFTEAEAEVITRGARHVLSDTLDATVLRGHDECAYALADLLAGRIWQYTGGSLQSLFEEAFEKLAADRDHLRTELDTIAQLLPDALRPRG
jgi:hypothetical protein